MPNQGSRFFADEALGSVSSVVATLPAGAILGEERTHAGVSYRLCFNAGTAQISQGLVASPVALVNCTIGSVAVSTLSNHGDHLGAVVAMNATAPTANFFWGAFKGVVGGLQGETVSLPTGSLISVGNAGAVMIASVASSRIARGYVITTVSHGGTANGNAYVDFT